MVKRNLSFLICLIFISVNFLPIKSKAQRNNFDNLSITGKYYSGFILPEYSNLTYLIAEKVQSASLSISKQTTGKNIWEQLYNHPEYGLTLFYSTLGNNKIHGREIALYPYFVLNIISREKLRFYNQTGMGIAYITRKFDPVNNYLNVAVGSHVNIHFNLRFGLSYKILEKVKVHAGVSFEHFSNAKTRDPNLGLNYVTGYSGLSYQIGNYTPVENLEITPPQSKKTYEIIVSCGSKRPSGFKSKSYFTASATFELKWQPLRALHFGIGTDVFYDGSTQIEMFTVRPTDHKNADNFLTGIHLSQEFLYGRLSLILQEGIYAGLKDKRNKPVMYNRGIVRYGVFHHYFIQLAMKSHLHILDYPEIGLGYKW